MDSAVNGKWFIKTSGAASIDKQRKGTPGLIDEVWALFGWER